MAQVTNTFDTYDAVGNRETLANMISMITPSETPAYSLFKKEKTTGVRPEWQTDTLDTPSVSNAQVQGYVYDYDAITATTRVSNYTQIYSKEFIVAETQEAVDAAGRSSDFMREKLKKGTAMRTDIEVTILSNNASLAGSSATAPQTGGLRAWLASNDSLGATGASGGYNSGTGVVDAATNGTQRAMTKAIFDEVMEDTYTAGGNPSVFMCSPYVKRVVTTALLNASGTTSLRTNANNGAAKVIGAVEEYLSDFGTMSIVPNRQMARVGAAVARNAFFIDLDKVSYLTLRPIQEDKDVAKTSDARPGVLKHEGTLCVKNEAAHGVAADLYGIDAST